MEKSPNAAKFRAMQYRMIAMTIVGYMLFYFLRKNLSLAMPGLAQDYGITKSSLGLFLTIHGLVYGLGKFVNGPWCDRSPSRRFMLGGLFAVMALNTLFAFAPAVIALFTAGKPAAAVTAALVPTLGTIWVANGFCQSMGNPPCVKLLSHWIPPSELATKLMFWNASHSIGAGLIAILCGAIMSMGTPGPNGIGVGMWRWCFWAPVILAAVGAIVLYLFLPGTPEEEGMQGFSGDRSSASEKDWNREEMVKMVYRNPAVWLISVSCFMVYWLRFAILDWGPMLLHEAKHVSLAGGGWSVAAFELAGIAGGMASGVVTDRWAGGRALRVCFFMMLAAGICMGVFWLMPPELPAWQYMLPLAGAGFFIYGPQGLTAVAAINLATKRYAATVVGLTSLFSYASVIASGWGMGALADATGGWSASFICVLIAAAVGCAIFLALWNVRPPEK